MIFFNSSLSFSGLVTQRPSDAAISCIVARQLCYEDPACAQLLEIVPKVCGLELGEWVILQKTLRNILLIPPVISLWCTLKYCFWLNVKWWVNIAVTHVTLDLVTELCLTTEVSTAFLKAVVTSTFIHYHQSSFMLSCVVLETIRKRFSEKKNITIRGYSWFFCWHFLSSLDFPYVLAHLLKHFGQAHRFL